MQNRLTARPGRFQRSLRPLVLSVLAAVCAASGAHAQSTSARIFGWGPAGQTVKARSNTGATRHTTIDDSGRYTLRSLPLGLYAVTLEKDGKIVDTRRNIPLAIGRNAEVDFACPDDKCAR